MAIGRKLKEFLDLGDTPKKFSGKAGKVIQVNEEENALEFGQDLRPSASPTFAGLTVNGNINLAIEKRIGYSNQLNPVCGL